MKTEFEQMRAALRELIEVRSRSTHRLRFAGRDGRYTRAVAALQAADRVAGSPATGWQNETRRDEHHD